MAVEVGSQKVFGFVLPAGSDGELIKQTIISVMTALFLLTVFFLFVLPRFADLAEVSGKVRALQEQSDNLTRTLDALDSFRQNITDTARESVFLAIPRKFDPGYILLSLRQLTTENRVNLVSYSLTGGEVGATAAVSGAGLLPHLVRVEISGQPINLINFVDSLDQYLPVGSVTELSLSEVSRVLISGFSEAKITMSLNFYHMPVSAAAAESLSGKYLSQSDIDQIDTLATYKRLGRFAQGTPVGVGKENLFGL